MANEVFQCEFSRGLLKKIPGNEKTLFLEISNNSISGKAIVYPENSGNEYTSDINYDIRTITKIEKIAYQGLDTFVIYVRSSSLYGVEKLQLRFPGMRDISRASVLLRDLIEANKGSYSSSRPMNVPEPPKSQVPPMQSRPAPPRPAPAPIPEPEPVRVPEPVPMPEPEAEPIREIPIPEPEPVPVAVAPMPSAPVTSASAADTSFDERRKQFEKMEAIYQTGMITEKEYKSSKAEYISSLNGLEAFYSKIKVNLQYSEIGFLSEQEFADFKRSTVEDCADLNDVDDELFMTNMKKLSLLNLCDILSDSEYDRICDNIIQEVQYISSDPEDVVVEKIQKWPILKECEILSAAQYDQLIKIVADDTRIKMGDSIPSLEHKLTRLTTLTKTFIFTPEDFAAKKQEFVADMTVLDFSSEAKLRNQIERLMTLRRCNWIDASEYQDKKRDVLQTIEANNNVVEKMQLFSLLTEIGFINLNDYENFKQRVIESIFQQYSDISELQKKAQTLMSLKDADIITEAEFNDYKKKLLAL